MLYAHRGFRRTEELFERAQRVVPGGMTLEVTDEALAAVHRQLPG